MIDLALLTQGQAEVAVNQDGACDAEGWASLEATAFGVGLAGETFYADLGDGWSEVADGELEREDGALFFDTSIGD